MRTIRVVTFTLLALVLGQASLAQSQRLNLDIKPQPIKLALRDLGEQTGIQILFRAEDVAKGGVTTPRISGQMSPKEALDRMLAAAPGLTYEWVNAHTVMISARDLTGMERGVSTPEESMQVAQAASTHAGTAASGQNSQEHQDTSRATGDSSDTKVQEITVTASKRAERLQDVPISIAVVTADDIDRRGLVNAADYLRGIPGVNQVDSAEGQSIVIRGMETSPYFQNFSSGPTTATYFGETPTTTAGGLGVSTNIDIKLVDIERVEVLRGPQGTAFGNSSIGGAVRTIPVAPRLDRFAAKLAGGYSSTSGTGGDNHNIQAIANIPLVKDKLAIRAVGYQYQDSGFYTNVAGSDPAFQIAAVVPYGAQGFAVDKEEVGSADVRGGRIAALFQPIDDLRLALNYLTQKGQTDGFAIATSGTYEQTMLRVAPEHVVRGQGAGVSDTDIDIANAVLEYDLGSANLLATYSHSKSGSIVSAPYQLSGRYWPTSYISDSDHREDVGEIRLATHFDGAWNFLAGIYAENIDDEVLFDYRWFGDPATNIACAGCAGSSDVGDQIQLWDLRQKAAFGEVSWKFAPRFTLTGGVRTYDYDRTIRTSSPRNFFFGPVAPGTTRTATDASGTIFRGNLSYQPNGNALVYAGWSQGFRLGKPQPALPAGVCDLNGDGVIDGTGIGLASTGSVESDDVDNLELGGKFALFDRRLTIDAAVFRMEWSGLPVRAGTPAPCNRAYNTNAGTALSEGVEFQANVQVTEPFRVEFGGSWIDARLTEDVPLQGFTDGDRLAGSPEVNANLGLQYEFKIGGIYRAWVRADSTYTGSFYGDILQSPNTKSGDYVKLDASVRVKIGNLDVDFFARNLTNEDAFTFRGILPASPARPVLGDFYGYRLRPRTIGLQLGYSF